MDPKSAAQTIRDTVSMDQILSLYGYHTKRGGFMICPFHGDTDASLKIYKGTGGWHCFGCGKGGSVVDFVMEHENCDFRTAVTAIDKALRLGLVDPREDPDEAERRQMMQKWCDDFVQAVYAYLDALKLKIEADIRTDLVMVKELEMIRQTDPERIRAEDYDFMNQWKEKSEYNEYKLERIENFREEVAAWRRKARRVKSA